MKKYLAEFAGTFILTLTVIASVFAPVGWPTAVLAGIALAIIVLIIGNISGAHINPGITLGALSVGKISKKDALIYIIAQLLGGLGALLISKAFGQVMPDFITEFSMLVFFAEVVGMTIFSFGVASVIFRNRGEGTSALVAGGSLLVGAYIAGGLGSYGLLNPAIALGTEIWSVPYLIAPLVGGVLGMWIYKYLHVAKAQTSHQ